MVFGNPSDSDEKVIEKCLQWPGAEGMAGRDFLWGCQKVLRCRQDALQACSKNDGPRRVP